MTTVTLTSVLRSTPVSVSRMDQVDVAPETPDVDEDESTPAVELSDHASNPSGLAEMGLDTRTLAALMSASNAADAQGDEDAD
jgi:hypothetical protein